MNDYKVSLINSDMPQKVKFNILIEYVATGKQYIARVPDDYFAYGNNKIFTLDNANDIIRELVNTQCYQITECKSKEAGDENTLDIILTLTTTVITRIELKESMTFRAVPVDESAEQREIRNLKRKVAQLEISLNARDFFLMGEKPFARDKVHSSRD